MATHMQIGRGKQMANVVYPVQHFNVLLAHKYNQMDAIGWLVLRAGYEGG